MLAYIKWKIKNIELNNVIILTNSWIWYEVFINELLYSKIYDKEEIELFLYHSISENWQTIFWFFSVEERNMFKELIKISWVWGRVAQNILSLWVNRLKKAIIEEDKKTIETIKWVWKKMAEKIVLELKDKDILNDYLKENTNDTLNNNFIKIEKNISSEIIQTLTLMWYNQKRVEELLQSLPEWIDKIDKIIPYIIKNI